MESKYLEKLKAINRCISVKEAEIQQLIDEKDALSLMIISKIPFDMSDHVIFEGIEYIISDIYLNGLLTISMRLCSCEDDNKSLFLGEKYFNKLIKCV